MGDTGGAETGLRLPVWAPPSGTAVWHFWHRRRDVPHLEGRLRDLLQPHHISGCGTSPSSSPDNPQTSIRGRSSSR